MSKKRFDPVYLLIPLYALILIGSPFVMNALKEETESVPVSVTVEEIPATPVPDLCLDVNTLCEQANQFGYNYTSTLYFDDETAMVLTMSSTQVDNQINRGHVIANYTNHYVDSWFDTQNYATYSTFGNGLDTESDWFCTVAGENGDPLSLHIKDVIDYVADIDAVQNIIDTISNDKVYYKGVGGQGIWYYAELPNNTFSSSTGLLPEVCTARIFVPKDDSLVTQVDFILEFPDNHLNLRSEVIEHEFEIVDDYYCDVPAIITEELAEYDVSSALYNSMMR